MAGSFLSIYTFSLPDFQLTRQPLLQARHLRMSNLRGKHHCTQWSSHEVVMTRRNGLDVASSRFASEAIFAWRMRVSRGPSRLRSATSMSLHLRSQHRAPDPDHVAVTAPCASRGHRVRISSSFPVMPISHVRRKTGSKFSVISPGQRQHISLVLEEKPSLLGASQPKAAWEG